MVQYNQSSLIQIHIVPEEIKCHQTTLWMNFPTFISIIAVTFSTLVLVRRGLLDIMRTAWDILCHKLEGQLKYKLV